MKGYLVYHGKSGDWYRLRNGRFRIHIPSWIPIDDYTYTREEAQKVYSNLPLTFIEAAL